MTIPADGLLVDGDRVAQSLQQATAKWDSGDGDVLLDFSGVRRIDTSGVTALEEMATAAEGKPVKVSLRGVNVDVYKVLKLAKLAARLSFLN